MSIYGFLAVGLGAAFGATLRWWLGLLFNPVFPTLPLGTLAANLLGGFLIGIAVVGFERHTSLPPEARLFVITGFMGALTTFSTFSVEVTTLLSRTEVLWGMVAIGAHVLGSLAMTVLGMLAAQWLRI